MRVGSTKLPLNPQKIGAVEGTAEVMAEAKLKERKENGAKAAVTGRQMNTRTIQPKLAQQSQYCASTTLQSKEANQEADESTGVGWGGVRRAGVKVRAGRPEEENQDK